jgi:Domain of unknown function (DUF4410)
MQNRKLVAVSALVVLISIGLTPAIASAGQSGTPAPQGVEVDVADFELPIVAPDCPSAEEKGNLDKDLQLRSRQIQDSFAGMLVETLQKQGYTSSRKQSFTGKGMLLVGVFAEPDQKNRIRRALLGSGSSGTKFILYVGAFDRRSASQPLYKESPAQEPDPNYGPVITLNVYIPMGRYEIDKDATHEDIRKICGQIAADVTALLQRNPAWVAQAQ